jgi:hypothetical protein
VTSKQKLRDYIGQFGSLRDELDPQDKVEGPKHLFFLFLTESIFK